MEILKLTWDTEKIIFHLWYRMYTAVCLLYICATCLILSRLCISPKNVDATFIILKTTSDIFQNSVNGLLLMIISDCTSEV